MIIEIKHCSSCCEDKPFNAFYKDISKKDGCSSFCRNCRKKSSQAYYVDNREIVKEKQKQYSVDHEEQIRKQKHQWREANLDHARQKSRDWGKENKDRCRQNHHEWNEQNREHLREYGREWRDLNREAYIAYQHNYRIQNPHIILNAANRRRTRLEKFSDITKQEWRNLMFEYEWKCFYCDKALTSKIRTIDHLIPLSKGGRHHIMNLIPCCRICNTEKNAILYPVWRGIKALSEDKLIHFISRIMAEMHACHFQISDSMCPDQLFKEVDGILKIQVTQCPY